MKKIIVAITLLTGVQIHADAQILKKIGNAIDKAAKTTEQVLGSSNNNQNKSKDGANKPVSQMKVGDTSIKISGDMYGLELNWIGAQRIYGSTNVNLKYQLFNKSDSERNVALGESNSNVYVIDQGGNRYICTNVFLSGKGMQYSNQGNIAAGTKDLHVLRFSEVPTSVTRLDNAIFGILVYAGTAVWNIPEITLSNIPISLLPSITAKGICGEQKVLIGSAISQLPKTFAHLYDDFTINTEDDESETITTINFTYGGKTVMTAISNDQKTIANIDVYTPDVYVRVDGIYYTCGDKFNRIKYANGITKDDYGNVSYQNIYFDEDTNGNLCAIHI